VVENGDFQKELTERLGRTKRLILIELSKGAAGYKKLSKKLRIGLDTIRSHVKTGKHSKSLTQLGLIKQEERGWSVTDLGTGVLEMLKRDPEFAPFFVVDPNSKEKKLDS
jgi:predicted transcriptional regulator